MWQVRLEAFSDWSIEQWIEELLKDANCFPLLVLDRKKMLNFVMVCMEKTWMVRNQMRLKETIPSWEELSYQTNMGAKRYGMLL